MLKRRAIQLHSFDILCLVIACNTAHILIEELQSVSKIPFISMINEVAKQVNRDRINKVGLMATPSTIKYALYQKALKIKVVQEIPYDKRISESINKRVPLVLLKPFSKASRAYNGRLF